MEGRGADQPVITPCFSVKDTLEGELKSNKLKSLKVANITEKLIEQF